MAEQSQPGIAILEGNGEMMEELSGKNERHTRQLSVQ